MILKNKAVVVTDEDGTGVNLCDDESLRIDNAHNILVSPEKSHNALYIKFIL